MKIRKIEHNYSSDYDQFSSLATKTFTKNGYKYFVTMANDKILVQKEDLKTEKNEIEIFEIL